MAGGMADDDIILASEFDLESDVSLIEYNESQRFTYDHAKSLNYHFGLVMKSNPELDEGVDVSSGVKRAQAIFLQTVITRSLLSAGLEVVVLNDSEQSADKELIVCVVKCASSEILLNEFEKREKELFLRYGIMPSTARSKEFTRAEQISITHSIISDALEYADRSVVKINHLRVRKTEIEDRARKEGCIEGVVKMETSCVATIDDVFPLHGKVVIYVFMRAHSPQTRGLIPCLCAPLRRRFLDRTSHPSGLWM
jgi:hypothetical protein